MLVQLLVALAVLTLWGVALHTIYALHQERLENRRLRDDNSRLVARIGYEYHLHLGTPHPTAADLPEPELNTRRLFSMKQPPPLTSAEKASQLERGA